MTNEKIYIDNICITVYRKRVKNINLRISRDGSVTISANIKTSLRKIEEFVTYKKDWIITTVNKMKIYNEKNENVKEQEYITGDTIILQSKKYNLVVIQSNKNKAEIEDDTINLYTTNTADLKNKKKIIYKLMHVLAQVIFDESLNRMLNLVKSYNIKRPEMKIRKMRSRWGSCNRLRKKITMNLELIKVNKECLDYVMLHELIHFLVAGHNKSFYNYMTILMPDWKIRKKMLNEHTLY